jgi:hypothetical protein
VDAAQSGAPQLPRPRAADMKLPIHFRGELASADCQIATTGSDSVQGASVDDCGLMAESRNVRKEKMRGWQAVPAGSAQVIRTSTRFAVPMGPGHLRCHFPGNQQRPDVNSRLSIEHSTVPCWAQRLGKRIILLPPPPERAAGIEKAPGRLTAGALAAPFSPGGSIKAATEIISVVRKNSHQIIVKTASPFSRHHVMILGSIWRPPMLSPGHTRVPAVFGPKSCRCRARERVSRYVCPSGRDILVLKRFERDRWSTIKAFELTRLPRPLGGRSPGTNPGGHGGEPFWKSGGRSQQC